MNPELKSFLDKHLQDDTDTNTMSAFPLPCGAGKSEYIRYAIADALKNNYGLIIVTDGIDRLNSYTSAQDEQLTEYIKQNLSRISILSSKTVSAEVKVLFRKPIVLMSTQRYFNLSVYEIRQLIATRKKVIIDEKPYIFITYKLTIEALNNVDSALKGGLDDTVNQNDKETLISTWKVINSELQKELKANEALNTDYKREIYFMSSALVKSEDVETFYTLIEKYKPQLRRYNADIVKIIDAVEQLITEGIITSQKVKYKNSGNSYNNYFTVLINNISKLTDIGAAVFVLDGTSDISPEYGLNCIEVVDCSEFQPNLRNLTINIVNINTSKDRLTKSEDRADKLIKTIIDYIKAQPQNIDTIFTYKAIAKKFDSDFENVNWFGNIKGKNMYRDINHICQVG